MVSSRDESSMHIYILIGRTYFLSVLVFARLSLGLNPKLAKCSFHRVKLSLPS